MCPLPNQQLCIVTTDSEKFLQCFLKERIPFGCLLSVLPGRFKFLPRNWKYTFVSRQICSHDHNGHRMTENIKSVKLNFFHEYPFLFVKRMVEVELEVTGSKYKQKNSQKKHQYLMKNSMYGVYSFAFVVNCLEKN